MSEVSVHTDSFDVYLHIPFCATRCGYCGLNTYTPGQLDSGVTQGDCFGTIVVELEMTVVKYPELVRSTDIVSIGDGTPSMLGASDLRRLLDDARNSFGLADDAGVTTESNPGSTSPEFFEGLAEIGFTRVNSGTQSAVLYVLTTLDRTHVSGRPTATVAETRAVDFEHINLDAVYGTPGESTADLDTTLEAVLATRADHISVYSLIVESDTVMARKVRHGELPMPGDGDLADRYERIDTALSQTDLSWCKMPNRIKPGDQCRHNMIYWRDGNWWGADPGTHPHLDSTRFYSVKHPACYTVTISGGELPTKDSEELTVEDRHTKKIMLGLRLAEGIDTNLLGEDELGKVRRQAEVSIVELVSVDDGQRTQLTDRGHLLADVIIVDVLN